MHIKTNVELSSVQIAILAICPLITVVGSVSDAVYFVVGTAICLLLSQLFCWIFNKYMGNAVKVFVCALTSAFVVVMGTYIAREMFSVTLSENMYYIIFSAVVMSSDFIYFRHKAATNHTILNFFKVVFIYSLVLFVFSFIKEFLTMGTVLGKRLLGYDGYGFFNTVASDFLILGILCALFD
jgi:Na+-transporting NADH:ubiquinone oxidoreductase subunit NqrD